jgi:hypothetical protein
MESDSDNDDRETLIRDAWLRLLDRPTSRAVIDNNDGSVSEVMGKLLNSCLSQHVANQVVKYTAMYDLAAKLRRKLNSAIPAQVSVFTINSFITGIKKSYHFVLVDKSTSF